MHQRNDKRNIENYWKLPAFWRIWTYFKIILNQKLFDHLKMEGNFKNLLKKEIKKKSYWVYEALAFFVFSQNLSNQSTPAEAKVVHFKSFGRKTNWSEAISGSFWLSELTNALGYVQWHKQTLNKLQSIKVFVQVLEMEWHWIKARDVLSQVSNFWGVWSPPKFASMFYCWYK